MDLPQLFKRMFTGAVSLAVYIGAHRHGYLLHTYVPPKSQIILHEYPQ